MFKKFMVFIFLLLLFSCQDTNISNEKLTNSSSLDVMENEFSQEKLEQIKVGEKTQITYINDLIAVNSNNSYKINIVQSYENKIYLPSEYVIYSGRENPVSINAYFVIETNFDKKDFDKIVYKSFVGNEIIGIENLQGNFDFHIKDLQDLPSKFNPGKIIFYQEGNQVKEEIILPKENDLYLKLDISESLDFINSVSFYYNNFLTNDFVENPMEKLTTRILLIDAEFDNYIFFISDDLFHLEEYYSYVGNKRIQSVIYNLRMENERHQIVYDSLGNQTNEKIDYNFKVSDKIILGDFTYSLSDFNIDLNQLWSSYDLSNGSKYTQIMLENISINENIEEKVEYRKQENYLKTQEYYSNIAKKENGINLNYDSPYYNLYIRFIEYPGILFNYQLNLELGEKPENKPISIVKIDKEKQKLIKENGDVNDINLLKKFFGDTITIGCHHISIEPNEVENFYNNIIMEYDEDWGIFTECYGGYNDIKIELEKLIDYFPLINLKKVSGDYFAIFLNKPFFADDYGKTNWEWYKENILSID